MRRSRGTAAVVALALLLVGCAPDPAEQDFLDTYDELVLDQTGYPEPDAALDAGWISCHVMAREDDTQTAVDEATRSVADRLDVDDFLGLLVAALAAQTLCPDEAPVGFVG